MNANGRLNQVISEIRAKGIEVRFEILSGNGGGYCEFATRKVLFIDLSLSASEQLELLFNDPAFQSISSFATQKTVQITELRVSNNAA